MSASAAQFLVRLLLMSVIALGVVNECQAKDSVLGVAFSPANLPNPADKDIENFFDEAQHLGSHISWIVEWRSLVPLSALESVRRVARAKSLGFHLYLSPIALEGGRKTPAIPADAGGNSFSDPKVREAYKQQALEFAKINPEFLGIGTEVNFLAQNPDEFEAFVQMAAETCRAVKEKFPDIKVTTSFQWDFARSTGQMAPLKRFNDCFDTLSFTSYPFAPPKGPLTDPSKMPDDYYSEIRKLFPSRRIGVSEIGWTTAPPWSEDQQEAFFARLPELMRPIKPEYVTLAMMHDVRFFSGELSPLNSCGVRHRDGSPKKSWDVILSLPPAF